MTSQLVTRGVCTGTVDPLARATKRPRARPRLTGGLLRSGTPPRFCGALDVQFLA
jgi:hypothetical protein